MGLWRKACLGQVREVHADPEPKRGGAKVRRRSPASSHLSWADPACAVTRGFDVDQLDSPRGCPDPSPGCGCHTGARIASVPLSCFLHISSLS